MTYAAPVRDLSFAAIDLADLAAVNRLPAFADAGESGADLLNAILDEAGKFAAEVLAPLNRSGDQQGVRLEQEQGQGRVITADGWRDAYRQFIAGGWNGLPFDAQFGGQGLPFVVSAAVAEIWHAANMAFALCPLLTQSAIEAIEAHGDAEQKSVYLPKLVSGEWSGTMNLTEPQAGSDLSAVRCRAVANGDHYLISGQKIFITYGDHDLTDNIIHLVLARTPDAPPGVKGISLFIVPKFLPDPHNSGEWTRRNDIETLSLEHKLGIHASPTAVLGYGNRDGAVGYLVGEENQGLKYMFTMMNAARHAVGVEGNGVAERAYQQAAAFAAERVQGRPIGNLRDDSDAARVAIIEHADVRRMLWTQKCRIEALRALGLTVAACFDHARNQPDAALKIAAAEMSEVLTPVFKGYATEMGCENVSLALQVHGGMGFIEETGAAQHYRDMRITPIYEGTTGIQAMDLIGRKLMRDGGKMTARVIAQIREQCATFGEIAKIAEISKTLSSGLDALEKSARTIIEFAAKDARMAAAVGDPYLRLWGVVGCGWQMAKAAEVCARKLKAGGDNFYRHKLQTAQFYFSTEMPKVDALAKTIAKSAGLIVDTECDLFTAMN